MRKIAAILLFCLFLFNFVGYKCLYYYLQQKANLSLEARLDKDDYNTKDLIKIKIPLSNPYQVSWNDFERVDGEVDIQGVTYKYVKRKVEDGQLVLLCIPHINKMHLSKACSDYNNGHDKKAGGSSWKTISLSEFEENKYFTLTDRPDPSDDQDFDHTSTPLRRCYIGLPGKPPQLV